MLKIEMGHQFKKGRHLPSNLSFGPKKLRMAENTEAPQIMTLQFFSLLNTLMSPEEPAPISHKCWSSDQNKQPIIATLGS